MNENLYNVHMGKAKCAVDLGDGSERGEYVNQDYILHKMGRPHRSISLMYCYYPFDKQWPGRISEVMKDANVSAVYKVNNQRDDKVRVARHSPYRRI